MDDLKAIAAELRRSVIQTIYTANSGHPGGSLSATDILTALYFRVMRHNPKEPRWPDRDRFVMSKGHASPIVYATLAKAGYFPQEWLSTFRKINSRLQGHVHIMTPGVEMSAGSLGQGLSFAVGTALAARVDGKSYHTYALLGDGECDEGQIWEAAMSAAHYKLESLTAIVDRNGIQNDRFTSEAMELEPLADKWRGFGWSVQDVDGHDFAQLLTALEKAKATRGKPSVLIAHTVKGKGVSFMENNPDFHGRAPNKEEYERAMKELS
ncbi:MAG: transketolase [Chloroflexota bacterium]|nr:transketolase [Chloroflexota bacterium]